MRRRLETHVVPEVTSEDIELRQRLSQGAFGTVYVGTVRNVPKYGEELEEEDSKLVAVKFLSETATEQERYVSSKTSLGELII